MMISILLLAAVTVPETPSTTPRAAERVCAVRQPHVPTGKLNHTATAMTCVPHARPADAPVRESRVIRPRAKT